MRKPKLVISKCLNSENCRYDGQGYNDKIIDKLREYIDLETVCPETAIGLTTPREPIRIEKHSNEYRLVQSNSNLDYTFKMSEFAEEFLDNLDDIDGFILKSKSPSCGIKDVKIYPKGQKCSIKKNGNGIFSSKVMEKYYNTPIEDEGRLKNYSIRDDFFTKIFTINNLKSAGNILDFHKKNTLLLRSYSESMCDELECIINKLELSNDDIDLYKDKVYKILSQKRNKESKLNIINKTFEKYKPSLSVDEIKYFQKLLFMYNEQKIPFSSLIVALEMYALRFDDKDLLNQTFFNPYPQNLISITDSGKGRNL